MKESILENRPYALALRIVKGCEGLYEGKKGAALSEPLLRSIAVAGTSARKAEYGESLPDVIQKRGREPLKILALW